MLICQKVTAKDEQMTLLLEDAIDRAILETREYLVSQLERFQRVEAEFTIPDIQNMAIAKFFVEFRVYYLLNDNSKRITIEKLQYFLDNIEDVAGEFEIIKKRNGWWSELYRQKWNINN